MREMGDRRNSASSKPPAKGGQGSDTPERFDLVLFGGTGDLVLLGMGADSHIASLFPGASGVEAALAPVNAQWCCTALPPPGVEPALPRLSLTLATLMDSRRIVIMATGAAKLAAFEQAALGDWPLPSPVHALAVHARAPLDFIWSP